MFSFPRRSRYESLRKGRLRGAFPHQYTGNLNVLSSSDYKYEQLTTIRSDDESDIDPEMDNAGLLSNERSKANAADWMLMAAFLMSLITLIATITVRFSSIGRQHFQSSCLKRFSAYSPALKSIEQEWVQNDPDDIDFRFTGEPRVEMTQAWNNITFENRAHIAVGHEHLSSLNKTDQGVGFVREPGKEDEPLVAMVEVFHQLHCVAMLQDYVYRDPVEEDIEIGTKAFMHRVHMDHCLFILLSHIRCNSDVTPAIFQSDPYDPNLWKPYTAPHLCRKFDRIWGWVQDHTLDYTPRLEHSH